MDLIEKVLTGAEISQVASTSKGEFEIRFPNMSDEIKIEQGVARRCANLPASSYPESAIKLFRVLATIDVLVKKAPDWWKGADACGDAVFIGELFGSCLLHTKSIEGLLVQSAKPAGPGAGENQDPPLGSRAFSHLTHGPTL